MVLFVINRLNIGKYYVNNSIVTLQIKQIYKLGIVY